MTPVDYVPGPQGEVLGGLCPEKVCFDAEARAGASSKEQLRTRAGGSPVRARVDQPALKQYQ